MSAIARAAGGAPAPAAAQPTIPTTTDLAEIIDKVIYTEHLCHLLINSGLIISYFDSAIRGRAFA